MQTDRMDGDAVYYKDIYYVRIAQESYRWPPSLLVSFVTPC